TGVFILDGLLDSEVDRREGRIHTERSRCRRTKPRRTSGTSRTASSGSSKARTRACTSTTANRIACGSRRSRTASRPRMRRSCGAATAPWCMQSRRVIAGDELPPEGKPGLGPGELTPEPLLAARGGEAHEARALREDLSL